MNRAITAVLLVVFLALTVRGFMIVSAAAPATSNRADASQTANYVLLALFAALSAVFGYRLLKSK